ncbi:MAG: MBL fold metallo-hydrolase [Pseudomonadota bacterium]
MRIYFWGTRGSIPISITADLVRAKIKNALRAASGIAFPDGTAIDTFIQGLPFAEQGSYGSNTSCLEIQDSSTEAIMICDAGSGLRDLGNHLLAKKRAENDIRPLEVHIFVSHLHWDHLNGFPFFVPANIAGNRIHIYGFHKELEQSFVRQQNSANFPLTMSEMRADISFHVLELDKEYEICGFAVKGIRQHHPGISYGYSFIKNGKKLVYSTDAEHYKDADEKEYPFVDFFRHADLLVFDAQYTFGDSITAKEHWGHSSNMMAVELAIRSQVKRLCLFHNEPTNDDYALDRFLRDAKNYASLCPGKHDLQVYMGYDGLAIEV